MASWHEPKERPEVYFDLWSETQDPYALLAWGRSLDRAVHNIRVKIKERVA